MTRTKPPKARPLREHLVLIDVSEVRGLPVAVFGRVRIPADVDADVLDVMHVEASDAAGLRRLLALVGEG